MPYADPKKQREAMRKIRRKYRKRKKAEAAGSEKPYEMWQRLLNAKDYLSAIEKERNLAHSRLKDLIREGNEIEQKIEEIGDSPENLPANLKLSYAKMRNDTDLKLTMQTLDFLNFLLLNVAKTAKKVTEPEIKEKLEYV